MNEDKIAAVRKLLDDGVAAHRQKLEQWIFVDSVHYGPYPYIPPTPRWKKVYWRVRGYLVTLWWALCGDDLEHARERDY